MNFDFDQDQQLLRETTRRLLEENLPITAVRQLLVNPDWFDEKIWLAGADLGWHGLLISEHDGGSSVAGQGLIDLVGITEELGRALYPAPVLPNSLGAYAVSTCGSDALKTALLPSVADGNTRLGYALAEPIAGWDITRLDCTLRRIGAGFTLDGVKTLVESPDLCDHIVVTANLNEAPVQVAIPWPTTGVTLERLDSLDPMRRLFQIEFDSTQVSEDVLLSSGAAAVDTQLRIAKVLLCAETVGEAEKVLELTTSYALGRQQFGAPIGSYQVTKHKLADMLVTVEAARAATHYAALAVQEGLADAAESVSLAKAFVGEYCSELVSEALQVFGGIGFTWEHDLHLYLKRVKSNEALFGTPSSERCRLVELLTHASTESRLDVSRQP